ncbi:hypothetical protein AWJ20_2072 [Sugiyamaella lignohabitans]|uniref:Rrn6p n=1 Tax=Sugiyamaella lignohabitans TaxID=796027 RepID=A0A161HFT5_9ASCO|nr:uncharacterized protein AWJ20_2072 [Sugiyamaella lignohabitans]ANB14480.1 hypothetical protein AWJ20_2072 [Sugiyamaella lignohabitans]
MWPSWRSQGPKLGYGHDGFGIYVPHLVPETPWLFARRHDLGYKFQSTGILKTYDASQDYRVINKKVDMDIIDDVKRRGQRLGELNPLQGDYIPNDLLTSYNSESYGFLHRTKHDPLKGSCIAIGSIRETVSSEGADSKTESDLQESAEEYSDEEESDFNSRQAIAYVNGKDQYQVKFGFIDKASSEFSSANGSSYYANMPDINVATSFNVNSPVMQVEFAEPEPEISPYMLVRSKNGTKILSVTSENDKIAVYDLLDIPFQSKQAYNFETLSRPVEHCHSTFNPWNYANVATINSQGVWSLWDLSSEQSLVSLSSPTTMSAFNRHSQTSSPWNKIIWGADSSSLYSINRKYLQLFDIRSDSATSSKGDTVLECTDRETHFRDMARSKINDNQFFVLDSKSVKWMDMRNPGSVLLSWDHFLDLEDTTIKLTVNGIKDNVHVVGVYSQIHQANFLYQFVESEGLPSSADDPILIVSPPDELAQSLELIPFTAEGNDGDIEMINLVRLPVDGALQGEILTSDPDYQSENHTNNIDNGINSDIVNSANGVVKANKNTEYIESISVETDDVRYKFDYILPDLVPVSKLDFRAVYEFLFENLSQIPEETSKDEDIENFARHLGETINSMFIAKQSTSKSTGMNEDPDIRKRRTLTLLELSEIGTPLLRLYNNLEDLSALIHQLTDHYKDTKISVKELRRDMNTLFGGEFVNNIQNNYDYLLSIWTNSLNTQTLGPERVAELTAQRKKLALYIIIRLTLTSVGVYVEGESKPILQDTHLLKPLSKYTQVRNPHDFNLTANTELLLDEWELGTNVDDYKWYRLGDTPMEDDTSSSVPDRYQQIMSQLSQHSQRMISPQPVRVRSSRAKTTASSQPVGSNPFSSPIQSTTRLATSSRSSSQRVAPLQSSQSNMQRMAQSQPIQGESSQRRLKRKKRNEGFG